MRPGLRQILKIFLTYKGRVALGVLCLLLVDAGQLTVPPLVGAVIDRVADGTADAAWLGWMALALIGLAIGIATFRLAWRHLFFVAAHRAELKLRHQVFEHALSLSPEQAQRTSTGEVMALATNDIESVRRALAMGLVAGFDAFVFSLFAVTAMFWLAPGITLWVVLPLPVLAIVMRVSLKAVYERWDRVQTAFEGMTERARESIAGVRVIKAFAQQAGDEARFAESSQAYFDHYLRYTRVDAIFRPAILLLTGACVAILLGVGGVQAIEQRLSVGTFVALATYLGMLTWPMIAAGWMAALLQRSAASMDRLLAFLARDREPQAEAGRTPADLSGAIDVRGLTFTYPGASQPALEDVSFSVPAGGSVGIVGEIGSGKSTLGKLLGRFDEPPPGTVFVDGRDVLELARTDLRRAVAWVPQEAFLFSDTIAANLKLGDPEADTGTLAEACRLAAVDEEIQGFEHGYQTLLGERGISLSGGQKQRVCLARALLKKAPILLLDDTLSAVDADTEREIVASLKQALALQTSAAQEALPGSRRSSVPDSSARVASTREPLADRTAVVISHRTTAVRDLDLILVLRHGRVIQSGTHAELIARPGYYRQMAELQELECCE